jgi:hypothetical protein
MPQPVRLTDAQMNAIWAAAHPLPRDRCSDFLADAARELAALPAIGDGSVHRVLMVVQRRYFDPPADVSGFHGGKYSR